MCQPIAADSGEVVVDESTAGATRRSVYLQQRRTEITSLLEVFDAPSIVTTCTQRASIDDPPAIAQPDEFRLHDRPRAELAMRLEHESARHAEGQVDGDARINQAFLLIIGREPGLDERNAARRFLETQPSHYPGLAEPECRHRALADFCQMMLASNAFLYIE